MRSEELQREVDRLLAEGRFDAAEALVAGRAEETPPEARRKPFDAAVRLRVDDEAALEAEGLGTDLATLLDRQIRNARYLVQSLGAPLRIVEEGDSWHQYPFILRDLIDVISDRYPVFSLSAPGDTAAGMVEEDELPQAVREHAPHVVLLSAGGNDLLGEEGLARVLNIFKPGMSVEDVIDRDALAQQLHAVTGQIRQLIKQAFANWRQTRVIIHGYDYPVPLAGGKWLGRPMAARGIPLAMGGQAVKMIVDAFNNALALLARDFPGRVFHADLRGTIRPDAANWHDELHPKNPGFTRLAARILKLIETRIVPAPRAKAEALAAPARATAPRRLVTPDWVREALDLRDLPADDGAPAVTYRGEPGPALREVWQHLGDLLEQIAERSTEEQLAARDRLRHVKPFEDHEALIDDDNLNHVNFLARGVRAARSVGYVEAPTLDPEKNTKGTGFLVAPSLLLTNNHVLPAPDLVDGATVEFDFEKDEDDFPRQSVAFRLSGHVFLTSVSYDYTFVAVEPTSVRGHELKNWGHLPLRPDPHKVLKRDLVNIVQHPEGDYKRVAMRENQVIGRVQPYIYYTADTDEGSSGSPVFNEEWVVAALHHMAIRAENDPRKYVANRGISISAILADVDDQAARGEPHAAEVARRIEALRQPPGDERLPLVARVNGRAKGVEAIGLAT